ncbi:MAG: hypothetical protein Q4P14_06075, partial [Methanobacteriaceae archaeon]|nr:hypothetical protein [Methanobacteriaceae archaeon]
DNCTLNESLANDSQFTKNPIKTNIIAPNAKFTYGDVKFLITLTDENGNGIEGKTIFVNIKGIKTYKVTTNASGVAIFKFKSIPKTYTASIYFNGDSNYLASKVSSKITIKKAPTVISAPAIKSYITISNHVLVISLKDKNGVALSNKKITVKIEGRILKLTTDKRGMVKIGFINKIRNTKVSIKFAGTAYYSASSLSSRVTITKLPVYITAPSIKYDSNKYGTFSVTLKNKNGKALKNQVVYVSIPSIKKTYKLTTNKNGVAKLKFNSIKSYSVVVKYKGSKYYSSKSVNSKFIVNPIKVKFDDVMNESINLKKYIDKNKKLPSKVTINNESYTIYQFSYLMSSAIKNINNGNKNDITLGIVSKYKKSSSKWIYCKLSKKKYVSLNNNVYNYICNNHCTPAYVVCQDKIEFKLYTIGFAKILDSYNSTKKLPSTCDFRSKDYIVYAPLKDCTFYLTSDNIRSKSQDMKMLKEIQKVFKSKGYKTKIIGVGPNMHNIAYKYGCKGGSAVLVCCFGGVDVGCIEEWSGQLGTYFIDNFHGARVLSIFYSKPYGACASLNSKVGRAWDANYGWALDNPAEYMESYGIGYIQGGSVNAICESLTSAEIPGLNFTL